MHGFSHWYQVSFHFWWGFSKVHLVLAIFARAFGGPGSLLDLTHRWEPFPTLRQCHTDFCLLPANDKSDSCGR